jgi:hypothetical protein
MNLRDLEAYLKIANYSITKIQFEYKRYSDVNVPFVVRDDLLLDNIVAEQFLLAAKARDAVNATLKDKEREKDREVKVDAQENDRSFEIEEDLNNS